jgi:two-component system sensor histidine kinase KdpD
VLAISTLVCMAIERYFDPANLITVYLAGVVYVALRSGRAAAVSTVVGSIVLFDLLFVPPRWAFKPADPQYLFTYAVALIVGLIISQLAGAVRQEAQAAEVRARRVQALNQLTTELVKARGTDAIGAAVHAAFAEALGVQAELLVIADNGGLPRWLPASEDDLRAAETALRELREAGAGTALEAGARRRYIPLLAADRPLAVLAIEPARAELDKTVEQRLINIFANQAAVALERAVFERRSAQAAVETETERLRSTLLAGISHDFRTPLTTIVGSAASLLEQGRVIGQPQREKLLRGVLLEAQRMHELLSDLLDLTRMEEGAVRPEPEWCPADELVNEARAALGHRLDNYRVSADVAEEFVVWCDARLVEQALVNLLDNAVRHTPAGTTIAISVKIESGAWSLVVHDDGPGIPAGQEQQIFKKFFRGQQDPETRGTGLGLAICAAVAELHGGTITATNARGARFEMRLPQPDGSAALPREGE